MDGSRGSRRPFAGRRVVLGVTGGIAAYKAIQVARDLALAGAAVDVVMTGGAMEFLRPLVFEAVTGRAAFTTAFTPGEPLTHIRLARDADVVVVAPATASFLARAAAAIS
jgi:phosphopantothenoylcysteine decarboxylase/phosphopantothenate--cysteine ligase